MKIIYIYIYIKINAGTPVNVGIPKNKVMIIKR